MARYDTDGSSALAPNDPYNNMEGADIRPSFQVYNGGNTSAPSKGNRDNFKVLDGGKSNNARDVLRNSENSALAKNEVTPWKNNVSGNRKNNNPKNQKGKGGFLKQKKGIAAIAVIISLLVGGGTFLGSSHLMLGPAMSSILTEKSDQKYTSTIAQFLNGSFMKSIMNKSQGTNNKPTNLSDEFITNLKSFDIDVNDNGSNYTFTYKGKTITGDNFSDIFENDAEFRTAFNNAKQGRAANFFDTNSATRYDHYDLTRNQLKSFQDTGDIDTDMSNYNKTLSQKFDKLNTDITTTHAEEKEETLTDDNGKPLEDADGNKQTVTVVENERNETASSNTSSNTDIEVAKTKASDFVSKIGKVTNVLNWGCTALRTGNMVIKTASAMERVSAIIYFMGIMEGISKMMAGEGSQSGYNALMTKLTEITTSVIPDYVNASASASYDTGKSDAEGTLNVNLGETTVTGAATESNLGKMLAFAPLDTNLSKNNSFDSMAALFTGAFGFTTMKAAGCAVSNIGESVASLAVNLLPGGQGVKIVGGMIFKAIAIGIVSFSIGSILGFLIPQIAKSLFMNTFLSLDGIQMGEQIARSSFEANGEIAKSAGNGYGTVADANEFAQITNTVLALEAESDRLNRSPFDINSKNTFLGSIAYTLLGTTLSSKTYSAFSSLASTTARSLASLTGGAYASSVNTGTDVTNTRNDCSFSHLLNDNDNDETLVAGTAWCTPLSVTNRATQEISPTDPTFINTINNELDADGQIKEDGDLAKTVSYCLQRDSTPSDIPDARILDELHTVPTILSVASTVFAVANDVVNIIDSFDDLANLGWGTGETCFTHPNMNMYKAYAIQETMYEQMMAGENGQSYISPVTAYIEKYNAEHPINSTTDLIARHAGLTTEDAELVIAMVEYYTLIDEYEPDSRLAMDSSTNKQSTGEEVIAQLTSQDIKIEENHRSYNTLAAITNQYIIYADVRNRSYAA